MKLIIKSFPAVVLNCIPCVALTLFCKVTLFPSVITFPPNSFKKFAKSSTFVILSGAVAFTWLHPSTKVKSIKAENNSFNFEFHIIFCG